VATAEDEIVGTLLQEEAIMTIVGLGARVEEGTAGALRPGGVVHRGGVVTALHPGGVVTALHPGGAMIEEPGARVVSVTAGPEALREAEAETPEEVVQAQQITVSRHLPAGRQQVLKQRKLKSLQR